MGKEKRFEKVYSQGAGNIKIFVDKQTGVNYLFVNDGYACGMNVLLDKDGKPIVTAIQD